jgi:hypothetical protein
MSILTNLEVPLDLEVDTSNMTIDEMIAGIEEVSTLILDTAIPGNEALISGGLRKLMIMLISLLDAVIGSITNSVRSLSVIYKDVAVTDLESAISFNRLNMQRIKSLSYSSLYKEQVPTFPFTKSPAETTEIISSMVDQLDAVTTLKTIRDQIVKFNSAISSRDISNCKKVVSTITKVTNPKRNKQIREQLISLIQKTLHASYEEFGRNYASMKDFVSIIEAVLVKKHVVGDLIQIEKICKKNYKLLDTTIKVAKNSVEADSIRVLKEFAKTVREVADMVDVQASVFQEYHHLEHNIASVLRVITKK